MPQTSHVNFKEPLTNCHPCKVPDLALTPAQAIRRFRFAGDASETVVAEAIAIADEALSAIITQTTDEQLHTRIRSTQNELRRLANQYK